MNVQKTMRRPVLAIALLIIALLTTTAFAAGGYVVYHIATGDFELPEGSAISEWLDFEPDGVLPYENFTEENGEVTVVLDQDSWNQVK